MIPLPPYENIAVKDLADAPLFMKYYLII